MRKNLVPPARLLHILQMDFARQVAALPVCYHTDGSVRILLVTSRETKRWVIPKGWPWPDCDDWIAAAEEAREEAGVEGRVNADSIGSFVYQKLQSTGVRPVLVSVYLLEVMAELETWPEQAERRRAWFTPAAAAAAVTEPELQELLRSLEPRRQLTLPQQAPAGRADC